MRRAYTAVTREDDVDGDIVLRTTYKDRKLFLEDECPVCCVVFGSEFAVFQSCGHVVCGACAAKLPRVSRVSRVSHGPDGSDAGCPMCPMCRTGGDIKVHTVDDAEFKRAMRAAGTMVPVRATEQAEDDARNSSVRYGKAVSADGLEGLFVEIQLRCQEGVVPAAHVPLIRRTFVVVDVSGSMAPVIPSIDLGPLVSSLVGTWLCIVTFGSEVDTIYEGVVAAGDVAPKLVSDGTTNLHGALDHVRRKIETVEAVEAAEAAEACGEVDGFDGVYDVMIVTDGEPDDAELAVLAIARVKKACFQLDVPAVARMHALRDTEREIAQYGEFPEIGAMVDGAKRGIVAGAEAERLHSTATAASVTAIARACTL